MTGAYELLKEHKTEFNIINRTVCNSNRTIRQLTVLIIFSVNCILANKDLWNDVYTYSTFRPDSKLELQLINCNWGHYFVIADGCPIKVTALLGYHNLAGPGPILYSKNSLDGLVLLYSIRWPEYHINCYKLC